MTRITPVAARFTFITPLAVLICAACGSLPGEGSAGDFSQALAATPSLGSAASFAVLGASTVTCTSSSAVTGDVGVSPRTAITGFNRSCTLSGTIHAGDGAAEQAHDDLFTGFYDQASAECEHEPQVRTSVGKRWRQVCTASTRRPG